MTRPPLANCNTLSNVSLYIGEPWTHVQLELLNEGAFGTCNIFFLLTLQMVAVYPGKYPGYSLHSFTLCGPLWLWLPVPQAECAGAIAQLEASHTEEAQLQGFSVQRCELPHGTRQRGDMGTPEKKWLIHC